MKRMKKITHSFHDHTVIIMKREMKMSAFVCVCVCVCVSVSVCVRVSHTLIDMFDTIQIIYIYMTSLIIGQSKGNNRNKYNADI